MASCLWTHTQAVFRGPKNGKNSPCFDGTQGRAPLHPFLTNGETKSGWCKDHLCCSPSLENRLRWELINDSSSFKLPIYCTGVYKSPVDIFNDLCLGRVFGVSLFCVVNGSRLPGYCKCLLPYLFVSWPWQFWNKSNKERCCNYCWYLCVFELRSTPDQRNLRGTTCDWSDRQLD